MFYLQLQNCEVYLLQRLLNPLNELPNLLQQCILLYIYHLDQIETYLALCLQTFQSMGHLDQSYSHQAIILKLYSILLLVSLSFFILCHLFQLYSQIFLLLLLLLLLLIALLLWVFPLYYLYFLPYLLNRLVSLF